MQKKDPNKNLKYEPIEIISHVFDDFLERTGEMERKENNN